MHTDARSRLSSIDALPLPATGQSEPVKVFDRHPTLNDTQIINYKTSADEKWMVLIGIKSEVSTPDQPPLRPPSQRGPRARARARCKLWLSA